VVGSQYLGDEGEAGDVGEYFGDIGDPWAGAKKKSHKTQMRRK
jgi:hypothetical protein